MSTLFKTAALVLTVLCATAGAQAPATAPVPTLTAEQRAQLEQWWDAQPKVNLPFDSNGAKLFIVEFTDLQCPFCRQKYIELKPILEKYKARPKDVTLLVKHWPISSRVQSQCQRRTCIPRRATRPPPWSWRAARGPPTSCSTGSSCTRTR